MLMNFKNEEIIIQASENASHLQREGKSDRPQPVRQSNIPCSTNCKGELFTLCCPMGSPLTTYGF